jgi:hypothetical protein
LVALTPPAAAAPPTWLPSDGMTVGNALLHIEELKEVYLECDRQASVGLLSAGIAASCSTVAVELQTMGFDGRAEALFGWWRAAVAQRRALAVERASSRAREGVGSS